jgi:hypothetical protein
MEDDVQELTAESSLIKGQIQGKESVLVGVDLSDTNAAIIFQSKVAPQTSAPAGSQPVVKQSPGKQPAPSSSLRDQVPLGKPKGKQLAGKKVQEHASQGKAPRGTP